MVCVGLSERDLKNFGRATGGARQNLKGGSGPPGTPVAPPLPRPEKILSYFLFLRHQSKIFCKRLAIPLPIIIAM